MNRHGYTMVELLVALVAGTLLLGAAYQALTVQERGYRAAGAIMHDQDALRIALAVLDGELREMAAVGGDQIGQTDILMASADSIRVRAPRKLGFVCSVSPSDQSMVTWAEGSLFEAEDGLLVFIENQASTYTDDQWDTARVSTVTSSTNSCTSSPTGTADQKVIVKSHSLSGVVEGSPVRGFAEVTYGLYAWDDGYGLGRLDSDGTLHHLVSGLAGPGQGLVFEYYDDTGTTTTDTEAVTSIKIALTTDPDEHSGTEPSTLTSTIYLRNN